MTKTKETKEKGLVAADLLKSSHPLHPAVGKWVKKRAAEQGVQGDPATSSTPGVLQLTRRKARRFLNQFPQYRKGAANAA